LLKQDIEETKLKKIGLITQYAVILIK